MFELKGLDKWSGVCYHALAVTKTVVARHYAGYETRLLTYPSEPVTQKLNMSSRRAILHERCVVKKVTLDVSRLPRSTETTEALGVTPSSGE